MEVSLVGTTRRVYREVIKVPLGQGDVTVPPGLKTELCSKCSAPQLVIVAEVHKSDVSSNEGLNTGNHVMLWLELGTQHAQEGLTRL